MSDAEHDRPVRARRARDRHRHRAVRRRAQHRGQVLRGPRLLRRRQPAARADRDAGRPRQPQPGRGHPARRRHGRAQPGVLHRPARRHPRPRRPRHAPAGAVPRGARRRAGAPLRERPPRAPAAGRRPARRRHRGRARAARRRCATRPTSSRHQRPLGARAAPRDRVGLRRRRRRTAPPSCARPCVSFGFKYGLPVDADLVVDVRFLPNPFWIPELRELTGETTEVRDYVLAPGGRRRSSSTGTPTILRSSAPATAARASAT